MKFSPQIISCDILIIGAGGSGIRAALAASELGAKVICISKVHPTRSHTVAAQGGINAALANNGIDDWRWHAFDTIKGSDYLADHDVVMEMCENAEEAIIELEHWGMAFTRDENGKIYQRAYGGQKLNYGKGEMARRACAVADRTGHAMLHILYQQALANKVRFLDEYLVIDLLGDKQQISGAFAYHLESGEFYQFQAGCTILASGGAGQIYENTTASSICTGDGTAMANRCGIALKDMEFVQFHPTGLYGYGILITEAARGEGAILRNHAGEAFMEKYSPMKDLAARDIIARAIEQERGDNPHIWLDLRHLDRDLIDNKLPTVKQIAMKFLGIDVHQAMIPVLPTVHYMMGGIRVDGDCQATSGLYACGENSCMSVHGANRLGCNALLELMVFGKKAGINAFHNRLSPMKQNDCMIFEKIIKQKGDIKPHQVIDMIKAAMTSGGGVIRSDEGVMQGIAILQEAESMLEQVELRDKSNIWNTQFCEIVNCHNLLSNAKAVLHSALWRKESRGSHYNADYPAKNDELLHSIYYDEKRIEAEIVRVNQEFMQHD